MEHNNEALNAFRACITRVDIENYNLCNRCCTTCPQSLGIRSKELEVFSNDLYEKLLSELAECQYKETLAIGRYHEPLLFPDLTIERIRLARKKLPMMRIILNTNGDFITSDMLRMLDEAGLDEIKIMRYQSSDYSTELGEKMCKQMAEDLHKEVIRKKTIEGVICYMQLEREGSLAISVRSENYYSCQGNGRGGLLPDLSTSLRTSACYVPQKSIDVDYNGDVVPCCNLISDSALHKPYVIGNIKNETIYDIYWKSTHSDFYNSIIKGMFDKYSVCQFCTYVF